MFLISTGPGASVIMFYVGCSSEEVGNANIFMNYPGNLPLSKHLQQYVVQIMRSLCRSVNDSLMDDFQSLQSFENKNMCQRYKVTMYFIKENEFIMSSSIQFNLTCGSPSVSPRKLET